MLQISEGTSTLPLATVFVYKKMSRATSDVDLADFLNVDFFYNNEYRLIFFVQIDITK